MHYYELVSRKEKKERKKEILFFFFFFLFIYYLIYINILYQFKFQNIGIVNFQFYY